MEIIELDVRHEQGLRDFVSEFASAGETEIPAYFADPAWGHEKIVEMFRRWSRGEALPEGWVPCTTFFLANDDRILAVANLRHRLTESLRRSGGHVGYAVRPSARGRGLATTLLRGIIEVARARGFDRLLVTCDGGNVASARVIEKCGGILEDKIYDSDGDRTTKRYWIAVS